jgi:hypothetical protein
MVRNRRKRREGSGQKESEERGSYKGRKKGPDRRDEVTRILLTVKTGKLKKWKII